MDSEVVFSQLNTAVDFLTSFFHCIVAVDIDLGLYFCVNISSFNYFSDCIFISICIN